MRRRSVPESAETVTVILTYYLNIGRLCDLHANWWETAPMTWKISLCSTFLSQRHRDDQKLLTTDLQSLLELPRLHQEIIKSTCARQQSVIPR